jgi:hypothetical protein
MVSPPPPNTAALIMISSQDDTPPAVGGGNTPLCTVTFRSKPAPLTQAQLNELQGRPDVMSRIKSGFSQTFDFGEPNTFTVDGVAGLEFEGKLRAGPVAGIPVYMAVMQTPKGVTGLTCNTPAENFGRAVPQFRSIRDRILPPR